MGGSDQRPTEASGGSTAQSDLIVADDIKAPEIKKEDVKLGLILGPGQLRVWSYIAALAELERAQVPIKAVIGLEWGSLPAALYAEKRNANHVEWQMNKIATSELVKLQLLSQELKAQGIEAAAKEASLFSIWQNERIEDFLVPFSCQILNLENGRYYWLKKGAVQRAILPCLSYPPLFLPLKNQYAGLSLSLAAEELRRRGATHILYVRAGDVGWMNKISPEDQLIWRLWGASEAEFLEKVKKDMEDKKFWVLDLRVSTPLYNAVELRQLIEKVRPQAKAFAGALAKEFGF